MYGNRYVTNWTLLSIILFFVPITVSLNSLTVLPATVQLQQNITVSWLVEDSDPASMNLYFIHANNITFPGLAPVNGINPHITSSIEIPLTQISVQVGSYAFWVTGSMAPASSSIGSAFNSTPFSIEGRIGSGISNTSTVTVITSNAVPTLATSSTSLPTPILTLPDTPVSSQTPVPSRIRTTPIGTIVGGTFGGLGAILAIIVALIWVLHRRRRNMDVIVTDQRARPFALHQSQVGIRETGSFAGSPGGRWEAFDRWEAFGLETIEEGPRRDVENILPPYEHVVRRHESPPNTTVNETVNETVQGTQNDRNNFPVHSTTSASVSGSSTTASRSQWNSAMSGGKSSVDAPRSTASG